MWGIRCQVAVGSNAATFTTRINGVDTMKCANSVNNHNRPKAPKPNLRRRHRESRVHAGRGAGCPVWGNPGEQVRGCV